MNTSAESVPDDALGVSSWEVTQETEVEFGGLGWTVLPSVYPMHLVRSSEFFRRQLSALPPVHSFLEVGCGAGALSVLAVKNGLCQEATGVDVNPNALAASQMNARRHGVEDATTFVYSDVFDAVSDSQFDLIFWNSNGALPDSGEILDEDATISHHERAIFDPGYASHLRYLEQGRNRVRPGGRLLIGFCGNGDLGFIKEKAASLGLSLELLATDDEGSHPHYLLEIRETSPA